MGLLVYMESKYIRNFHNQKSQFQIFFETYVGLQKFTLIGFLINGSNWVGLEGIDFVYVSWGPFSFLSRKERQKQKK